MSKFINEATPRIDAPLAPPAPSHHSIAVYGYLITAIRKTKRNEM